MIDVRRCRTCEAWSLFLLELDGLRLEATPREIELPAPDVALCPVDFDVQILGGAQGWRRERLPGQRVRLQRLDDEGLQLLKKSFWTGGVAQALLELHHDSPAEAFSSHVVWTCPGGCSRWTREGLSKAQKKESEDCFSVTRKNDLTIYMAFSSC